METLKTVFIIVVFIVLCTILYGNGGSSGRNGVGPYDFTDYTALEARKEMREAQMEMTKYPVDDYYDMLWSQSATEAAADALSDYLYEQYLQEQHGD